MKKCYACADVQYHIFKKRKQKKGVEGKMKKTKCRSKKSNLKSAKGITLLALVITIIVLIILAGVSISALLGDDGIVEQVGIAEEKTNTKEN